MTTKNNKWHFGGRLCAQCKFNRDLHKGCAMTGTNFEVYEKKKKVKKREPKNKDGR